MRGSTGDALKAPIDEPERLTPYSAMMSVEAETSSNTLDLRHIGRVNDKDMAIRDPGMEMSKPGSPDLRRRKFTVQLPGHAQTPGAGNPPNTPR